MSRPSRPSDTSPACRSSSSWSGPDGKSRWARSRRPWRSRGRPCRTTWTCSGGPGSWRAGRKSGTSTIPCSGRRRPRWRACSPPAVKKENAMSAKVHLHMHVSDLGKSRDFYERFLGEGPVKVKTGYVKFLPAWAPVNLAVSEGGHAAVGTVNHVGVQLETVDAVMAQLTRVKSAGLPVREEMGVNCCHANQDKFWVQDPDGVEWEVYHLNYDLESETVSPGHGGLTLAKGGSCCAS